MDSSSEPNRVCLNVAIDHRIRRLFRPLPRPGGNISRGRHADYIRTLGCENGKDEDKVEVTAKLAEPSSTGGIMVVLQQPRSNHPFEEGIEEVINTCPTLRAIQDSFATASCNTLNIVEDISIVDLLPYDSKEDMKCMDDEEMQDAFCAIVRVLFEKKPDVGEAWKVESVGVSRIFYQPPITLDGENNKTKRLRRVNGFHPSTAMNHYPEHSCLRQLLMLEIAQTCGLYRGDWKEERWMREFRIQCEETFLHRQDSRKFIPDYSSLYSNRMEIIRSTICNIASEPGDTDSNTLYSSLMNSRLSELCNDAGLILARLARLDEDGDEDEDEDEDKSALDSVLLEITQLSDSLPDSNGWFGCVQLRKTISGGIKSANESILMQYGERIELDLERASNAFIEMAEGLERILWDIMQNEE
ncbi:hypothetical protein BGZ63DRAFT_460035 [Mariannaea sp. PMI_226]|nr:hypothetical protein BGZ63DRAFT_460035 [Mariannaea sp. PMI_226]